MRRRALSAGVWLPLLLTLLLGGCDRRGEASPPAPSPSPPYVTAAPAETDKPVSTPVITPQPTPIPVGQTAAPAVPTASPQPGQTLEDGTLTVIYSGETHLLEARRLRCPLRESPALGGSLVVPLSGVTTNYVNNAWRFTLESEPEAAFLELSLVSGANAEELLPTLMDAYLDFTDIEFSAAAAIGMESIPTGTVAASNDRRLVRAWLADVEGGTVCLVLDTALDRLGEASATLEAMLNQFVLEK